jgi:catechol-2,3-dioxygenase
MNFQGVVINVAELDRSIEFYRDLLGFTVISQAQQLAALNAPGNDQPQIIVLRALGTSPVGGARHIGLRAFIVEIDSADELERIASDLDSRRLLVSRRNHGEWTALVGRDPDQVAVVLVWRSGEGGISGDDWKTLDDFLYGVGE